MKDPEAPMQVAIVPQGNPVQLLRWSARDAFRTMTAALLKKLFVALDVPRKGPVPSLEFTLCQQLVKFVFPEMTSDEIDATVRLRYEKRACPYDTTLDTTDVQEAAALFDDNDVEHVHEALKDIIHLNMLAKKEAAAKSGPSIGGGKKGPAKPPVKEIVVEENMDAEQMRLFIPQVKGYKLTKDLGFYGRWKGEMDRPKPKQRVVTQSFSVSSDSDALKHVVKTLWKWFKDDTGADCPFKQFK
jgi:hypothetical protein